MGRRDQSYKRWRKISAIYVSYLTAPSERINYPDSIRSIVARSMTREQLIEIARLCVRQACATRTKDVAAVLWRMAQEYLDKAAKLEKSTATR
jgi:hypothetical protein